MAQTCTTDPESSAASTPEIIPYIIGHKDLVLLTHSEHVDQALRMPEAHSKQILAGAWRYLQLGVDPFVYEALDPAPVVDALALGKSTRLAPLSPRAPMSLALYGSGSSLVALCLRQTTGLQMTNTQLSAVVDGLGLSHLARR